MAKSRQTETPDTARYEYFSLPHRVRHDPLSDLIDDCAPRVKGFGYEYGAYNTCGPRINGDMELIYVLSGESIVTINGETLRGYAGDLFVIPKYSYSEIDTNPLDPHENYWVHLEIADMICAERLKRLLGGPLLHPGLDRWLLRLYRWLDAEFMLQSDGCRMAIDALLKLIFLQIISLTSDASQPRSAQGVHASSRADRLLSDCVREIASCHGAISAGELCERMFISPAYLRRLFSDALGMPPSAFIRSVRMREAETLLLTTTDSLADIAARLGFSSPYHFSGEFRRCHSVSPSVYRATARGSAASRPAPARGADK